MKITQLLAVVLISIFMIGAVGCSSMQPVTGQDEYVTQGQAAPSRIYVEDPYHYGRTIVMDRDPVTGRYYQVNPYSLYDSRYDSRYYGDPYYNNRNYNYNDRYYSGRNSYPSRRVQQAPAQSEEQARQGEERRREAAQILLGKKKQ
jgi:hypothetical protein